MTDKVKVTQLPPEVVSKLKCIGDELGSITIDPTFWDPSKPWWTTNKSNHVVLMIVQYYSNFEQDEEIKAFVLPLVKLMAWLFVNHAAYRARLVWLIFFFDAYIADRQFQAQTGDVMMLETWADPRKWAQHLKDGTMEPPELIMCKPRDPNEVVR